MINITMDEEENEPIDIEDQLTSMLSDELSKSINEQIMDNLMFMYHEPFYESLVRENKINEVLGVDPINIIDEMGIDQDMFNRLEKNYNLNNNERE